MNKKLVLIAALAVSFGACKKSETIEGKNGANGADGADGISCTLDGNVLTCGEDVLIVKHGKDGANGSDGADGKDGANGSNGSNGANGKDGAPGQDGKDGAPGPKGDKGDKGDDGKCEVDLIDICHVPPGNEDAAHTLTISQNGWDNGHSKHAGDYLGVCEGGGDDDSDSEDSDDESGSSDDDSGSSDDDSNSKD